MSDTVKLTAKELADAEYMQAYVDAQHESYGELLRDYARLEAETIERCAKIAEWFEDNTFQVTELVAGKRIAKAIRSLAAHPAKEEA